MKTIRKTIYFVVFAATILSCSKNTDMLEKEITPIANSAPEVGVDNGILVFKSTESINNLLIIYKNSDKKEINEFENQLNFTSLEQCKGLNYRAIEQHFNRLYSKGYTDESLAQDIANGTIAKYPAYTQELLDKGYLAEIVIDGEPHLEFTSKPCFDTRLVNVDGMVVIGDTLYQFLEDGYKYMINGTEKDAELLKTITTSQPDKKIVVNLNGSTLKSALGATSYEFTGNLGNEKTGYSDTENRKVTSQLKYKKEYMAKTSSSSTCIFTIYLQSTRYQKVFWAFKWRWVETDDGLSAYGHINWLGLTLNSGVYNVVYGGTQNTSASITSYGEIYKWTCDAIYKEHLGDIAYYTDLNGLHFSQGWYQVSFTNWTGKAYPTQDFLCNTEEMHQP